jgi:hypothetical protein
MSNPKPDGSRRFVRPIRVAVVLANTIQASITISDKGRARHRSLILSNGGLTSTAWVIVLHRLIEFS